MKLLQLKAKDVFGTLGVGRNGQRLVVLVYMMKLIRLGKMGNLRRTKRSPQKSVRRGSKSVQIIRLYLNTDGDIIQETYIIVPLPFLLSDIDLTIIGKNTVIENLYIFILKVLGVRTKYSVNNLGPIKSRPFKLFAYFYQFNRSLQKHLLKIPENFILFPSTCQEPN